jgi:hypothetical protein
MDWRKILSRPAGLFLSLFDRVEPIRVSTFKEMVKEGRFGNVLYMWDETENNVLCTNFRLSRPALRDVVLTLPREEARTLENLRELEKIQDLLGRGGMIHTRHPYGQTSGWR